MKTKTIIQGVITNPDDIYTHPRHKLYGVLTSMLIKTVRQVELKSSNIWLTAPPG